MTDFTLSPFLTSNSVHILSGDLSSSACLYLLLNQKIRLLNQNSLLRNIKMGSQNITLGYTIVMQSKYFEICKVKYITSGFAPNLPLFFPLITSNTCLSIEHDTAWEFPNSWLWVYILNMSHSLWLNQKERAGFSVKRTSDFLNFQLEILLSALKS